MPKSKSLTTNTKLPTIGNLIVTPNTHSGMVQRAKFKRDHPKEYKQRQVEMNEILDQIGKCIWDNNRKKVKLDVTKIE